MEENVKSVLMWSADGVMSKEPVNAEEERSLIGIGRNMECLGSQAQANNKYGDAGECKKNKSCIYRTVDSRKQHAQEAFPKALRKLLQ